MKAQASLSPTPREVALRQAVDDLSGVGQVLAAGARARAVSDACEAIGLGAILLDRCGRVLHVGPAAAALFGADLRIEAEHVLGRDAVANAAIETVLNPILGSSRIDPTVRAPLATACVARHGAVALAAKAYDDGLAGQLMKAILFVGSSEGALRAGVAASGL